MPENRAPLASPGISEPSALNACCTSLHIPRERTFLVGYLSDPFHVSMSFEWGAGEESFLITFLK